MDHQSGALIGSSEDLLTEILIRLPLTSILRFKSVSKRWRLLLSNSHLTRRYDNINLSKSLGLFGQNLYVPFDVENRSPSPFRSLDFYFNRSDARIEQSCNGLLLCSAFHNDAREYYVFNPTTKQLALIPSVHKTTCTMALAFHQTHCMHYKVVSVCSLWPRKNMYQIRVYSSETRKWKICIKSFSVQITMCNFPVYCNGAVYFAPEYPNGRFFVCFKLDAEQLQRLPIPLEIITNYEIRIMYFGESRGHKHLIFDTDGEDYMLHFNVYEMLTDHSGWFVKYRLQVDELLPDFPCLVYQYETLGYFEDLNFSVVDLVRGKEEEDTFLVLATSGKMIRYNVHDKSCNLSYYHRYIDTLSFF